MTLEETVQQWYLSFPSKLAMDQTTVALIENEVLKWLRENECLDSVPIFMLMRSRRVHLRALDADTFEAEMGRPPWPQELASANAHGCRGEGCRGIRLAATVNP